MGVPTAILPEKRRALELWAGFVLSLTAEQEASNVIALHSARVGV